MIEKRKVVGVPMSAEMYKKLKELADRDHRSIAGQVRYVVSDYVDLEGQ
jgi:hypothetical protein